MLLHFPSFLRQISATGILKHLYGRLVQVQADNLLAVRNLVVKQVYPVPKRGRLDARSLQPSEKKEGHFRGAPEYRNMLCGTKKGAII